MARATSSKLDCPDGSLAVLTLNHQDGQAVLEIEWLQTPPRFARRDSRQVLGAGRAGVEVLRSVLGGTPAEAFMIIAAIASLEPYILCLAPHREDLTALMSDEDPLVRDIALLHVEHAR